MPPVDKNLFRSPETHDNEEFFDAIDDLELLQRHARQVSNSALAPQTNDRYYRTSSNIGSGFVSAIESFPDDASRLNPPNPSNAIWVINSRQAGIGVDALSQITFLGGQTFQLNNVVDEIAQIVTIGSDTYEVYKEAGSSSSGEAFVTRVNGATGQRTTESVILEGGLVRDFRIYNTALTSYNLYEPDNYQIDQTSGISIPPQVINGVSTPSPTTQPTLAPSAPTAAPSRAPSAAPTPQPSIAPSATPSAAPSAAPTVATTTPTSTGTTSATSTGTSSQTTTPTTSGTSSVTSSQTTTPTTSGTSSVTSSQTTTPTTSGTTSRTTTGTTTGTITRANAPTGAPSRAPSRAPTAAGAPTAAPSRAPSQAPTVATPAPNGAPSRAPSQAPTVAAPVTAGSSSTTTTTTFSSTTAIANATAGGSSSDNGIAAVGGAGGVSGIAVASAVVLAAAALLLLKRNRTQSTAVEDFRNIHPRMDNAAFTPRAWEEVAPDTTWERALTFQAGYQIADGSDDREETAADIVDEIQRYAGSLGDNQAIEAERAKQIGNLAHLLRGGGYPPRTYNTDETAEQIYDNHIKPGIVAGGDDDLCRKIFIIAYEGAKTVQDWKSKVFEGGNVKDAEAIREACQQTLIERIARDGGVVSEAELGRIMDPHRTPRTAPSRAVAAAAAPPGVVHESSV